MKDAQMRLFVHGGRRVGRRRPDFMPGFFLNGLPDQSPDQHTMGIATQHPQVGSLDRDGRSTVAMKPQKGSGGLLDIEVEAHSDRSSHRRCIREDSRFRSIAHPTMRANGLRLFRKLCRSAAFGTPIANTKRDADRASGSVGVYAVPGLRNCRLSRVRADHIRPLLL
jgi:hypothetical protein